MPLKERDKSIDIAKGIGIYLVCLGHTTSNEILLKWIYSFHMPLFFFLSGIFHLQTENYFEFFKKKTKSLLVPYMFFATTLFLFFLLISRKIGFSAGENLSVKENFIGIFIGTSIKGFSQVSWGGQLWFLLALFLVTNIMYFVKKLNLKTQILVNILMILFNLYLSNKINFYLPWCFITVLMAFNFYWIGNYFKTDILNRKNISNLLSVSLLIINLIISQLNGKIDMWSNSYGNLMLFFIGAYSGIIFLIFFIKSFIVNNRFLEYIGKNSLIILAYHRRGITVIKVIIIYLLSMKMPDNNITFDLILSLGEILICIPIIVVLNKYFPLFIGKKRRINIG